LLVSRGEPPFHYLINDTLMTSILLGCSTESPK
jgi:hypothetical protein